MGALLLARLRAGEGASPFAALFGPGEPSARPGGRIAVVLHRDVWAVDPASGQRQRLSVVPSGQVVTQLAWAPDATRLALSQVVYPPGQNLGVGGLYLLPAEGGTPSLVLVDGASGSRFDQPAWTPDGRDLIYLYSRLATLITDNVEGRLERVGADGRGRTTLIDNVLAPTLSRDGSSLAFVRRWPHGETLWVADGEPSAAREIVPQRRFLSIAYPRFSPDGARLAFAGIPWTGGSRAPGDAASAPLDLASAAAPPRLGSASARGPAGLPPALSLRPALLPDLLTVVGRLGSGEATLRPSAAGAALRPGAHGLPWDLWIVQRDGSDLRRLTSLAEDDASLAWSPDGEWLAFQGINGLYLVHYRTGRTVRLADKGEAAGIDWAP